MIRYRARLTLYTLNIIGGLVIVNLSYLLAFILRFWGFPPLVNFSPYLYLSPFITFAALIFFIIYGMHSNARKSKGDLTTSVFCITFLIFVSTVSLSYFSGKYAFPRTVLLLSPFLQMLFLNLWFGLIRRTERAVHGVKQVILVGDYDKCISFSDNLEADSLGIYKVIGCITESQVTKAESDVNLPVVGNFNNLEDNPHLHNKDVLLIICSPLNPQDKTRIYSYCLNNYCSLFIVPEIYDILLAQSRIIPVGDSMLIEFGDLHIDYPYRLIKRMLDVSVALCGLILTAVPMLLIAVLIKIDSGGPVLFIQERVGEKGRLFKLYKFRTMVNNAEDNTGPVLSSTDDLRITGVGKVLRALRLDELPQLINVLKGEMSLVGPRPERPYFANQYSKEIPYYIYRTNIKGGITGLAQVSGKYSTNPEDKLRYDLLYARSYTPFSDIKILLQTLKVILMKDKSL